MLQYYLVVAEWYNKFYATFSCLKLPQDDTETLKHVDVNNL